MNLSSKEFVQFLLKKYGFSPSKRLGQNFLVDKTALEKIVTAANLKKNEVVLEIGPGLGVLTQELAKKAGKVVSVEKDPKMIEVLRETVEGFGNVEIIKGDVRQIENRKLKIKNPYKIVANLPYYLTSPIIRQFLEAENYPKIIVLLVQKEVAQRICAKPPDMSLLAVSVQFYAVSEIISWVSKESFWPKPKVDSAIIRLNTFVPRPKIDINLFFKIVKAGFSHPRKQLLNNLSKDLNLNREVIKNWLVKNDIQPNQRAETLSVKNWIDLTSSY
ncbi:16S rRNA (adenine(1518)-N(6)/adenine(1519)-N(6))-dimethyltransferase RsmA [Patescibacteria group bacterium]